MESTNPFYEFTFSMFLVDLVVFFAHIRGILIIYIDSKYWTPKKTLQWVILTIFLGPIAFTIYYYLHKSTNLEPKYTDNTSILLSKPKEETASKVGSKPLAEYKETLYTEGSTPKKYSIVQKKNMEANDQRIWRDVKSIEKNVDNIDKGEAQKPSQELDQAVDRILFKRKRK
jgi:hypothetical protein